jgi:D-alanine-D-alanine ligase-like ATP-grasp enzyme
MAIKRCIYLGLDFILDKNKNLYFLEVNSSPGALGKYKEVYKNVRPIKELCNLLNQKYKILAVISRYNWNKFEVAKDYRNYFKGKVFLCPHEKNKERMKKGDGSLINDKGKVIFPDVVMRVSANHALAQEKAGIKVINGYRVTELTVDKIRTKHIVNKYTDVKVPRAFIIKNKKDINKVPKTILNKPIILKPRRGQKSKGLIICKSYKDIPKNFKINREYILEPLIECDNLFKNEFFEIRSMAVNGKYAGSMLFVSKKRPMHLFTEGRAVKIPKKLEIKVKKATEKIVKVLDKYC